MTTTSEQGGTQGGAQGGREFPLTASPINLPALTSDNGVQGGTARAAVKDQKSPETGDRSPPREGPSLSMGAGDQATTVSRCVTNPQRGTDRENVMVYLPVELPSLTTPVNRTLLAILVELTTVDMLNASSGGGTE